MKFFASMSEYYDDVAKSNELGDDIEYAALYTARDAVAAFDIFVKRNVDRSRQAQFADGSNREADLVRQVIRETRAQR